MPSVALRLNAARPSWKSIAGEQVPKLVVEIEAVVFEKVVEVACGARVLAVLDAAATGTHELVTVAAKRRARRMLGVCILMVLVLFC